VARYTLEAHLEATNSASSEIAALSADLGLLSAQLDHIDGRTLNVSANADTALAAAQLDLLERAVDSLDRIEANIGITADATDALFGLAATEAAARRLDGRDIDIDIDVDAAGAVTQVAAASAAMQALKIGATAAGQGISAAMRVVPLAGGALAGMGQVAVSAGAQLAALGPAGIAVGAALAGLAAISGGVVLAALGAVLAAVGPLVAALTIAATAAAGLAAGLALIGGPLVLLVREIAEYNEGLEKQAQAQEQAASAADALRAAEERAADAARAVKDARRSANEGVRAAIEQYRSSLLAVRDAERGVEDAARRVRDARRSANEGVRSAVDAYRSSLEGVEDAEQGLIDARQELQSSTRSLESAQNNLNRAYREEADLIARQELDLASLRLSEEEAAVRVFDAQRALNKARREGDPRAIWEAEIELQRAQLDSQRIAFDLRDAEEELRRSRRVGTEDLRRAKEEHRTAYRERREAVKGVGTAEEALLEAVRESEQVQRGIRRAQIEGARQVAGARREERRAAEALAEAIRSSEQTQRGIRRAQLEGARQIAAARRDEKKAQDAVADAVEDLAKATREARQATVGLSGAARILNNAWERLKDSAPKRLLKEAKDEAALLGAEVLGLARRALPRLLTVSRDSTRAMRLGFKDVREELGANERNSLTGILNAIPGMLRRGTNAVGLFGGGVVNFLREAVPFAEDFLESLEGSAQAFLSYSRSREGRREIRDFLDSAAEVADALGDFLKTVGGRLIELGNEHGPTAAAGIRALGDAISYVVDAMDFMLDRFRQLVNFFASHPNIFNFLAGQVNRALPGDPIGYYRRAMGGDVPMAYGGTLPGAPLWRASHGLDIPSHYVEDPALMQLGSASVLYGEALTPGHREYAFADGGNMRFITEEPGYDTNSYNLWRDLGERKGYIAQGISAPSGGVGMQTRRRDQKTMARIQINLDGKPIRDYTTEVVWENLQGGFGSEEHGL
jgi:hypothetical protein